MYKLILSWRYLRTRWIALASIISVTLGVATMIVVNSVMEGFATEMQNRIHGILSDVVVSARSINGMPDAEWHMEKIREVAGDDIEGMTPTVVVPAMLNFRYNGGWITRQVQLIGIDPETQGKVSDFSDYLQHPDNREAMSFQLHENGYDTGGEVEGLGSPRRPQMKDAGWEHRRRMAQLDRFERRLGLRQEANPDEQAESGQTSAGPWDGRKQGPGESTGQSSHNAGSRVMRVEVSPRFLDEAVADNGRSVDSPAGPATDQAIRLTSGEESAATDQGDSPATSAPSDPFAQRDQAAGRTYEFDPATEQHTGTVLGIALSAVRLPDGDDGMLVLPGDDVKLTFPNAGTPPKAITDTFTIVDFYESKMSEYDASFVFVPIGVLQDLRGMLDPATGVRMVSSIQMKLKPGVDGDAVRDKLRGAFDPHLYTVETWRDKQGPLLQAVEMEQAILNVLLFLIIAVAGFGILAIFLMIVVEKTRDIGILKSLGASAGGVMGIFLTYGLSLGIVGSGVGTLLGLIFVWNINEIADLLGRLTGRPVFDPSIYYFYQIPTIIEPWTIAWIVSGALAIAVLASVLPAMRAATLHPVEALRYE